jgi:hypothetical protein
METDTMAKKLFSAIIYGKRRLIGGMAGFLGIKAGDQENVLPSFGSATAED